MKQLTAEGIQRKMLDLFVVFHQFCEENEIEYYMIGGTLLGAIRHKGFIPWDDDIDVAMTRDNYEKFWSLKDKFSQEYEIKNLRNYKYCDFLLTRIYIPNTKVVLPYLNKNIDDRLYFDIFPLDYVPSEDQAWHRFTRKLLKHKKRLNLVFAKKYEGQNLPKIVIKKAVSTILRPFRKSMLLSAEKLISGTGKQKNAFYLCSCASQYHPDKQRMPNSYYGKPTLYEFEKYYFYGPAQPELYLSQLFGPDYMELPPMEKRRKTQTAFSCN